MSVEQKNIIERIKNWKKLLLDMTRRNRLLWYKPYRVGSLKLESKYFDKDVDNVLSEIDGLAFDAKVIEFIAEAEITNSRNTKGLPLLDDISDNGQDDSDDEEEKQRKLVKERAKSLSNILKKIKLENEEKGLNIGYIAVGFLKWYERDDSESEVKSPLIMIPIKVEQDGRHTPFKVSLNTDEQITLNPVIKKKFETDFNIILEDMPTEFDDSASLDGLLDEIKNKITEQPNWQVIDEVVLDTFSFQNLAIWNDLDKNKELIENNPFSKVLAGTERQDEGFYFEEKLDLEKVKAKDNLSIYEVDSSQQEAICRAKKGESFVIQGPPGTGKSQTITNIIAEMLFLGKKVLFVSEKQAALDVVYRKLENKGLADFCLILHNSKQRKSDVREQITKSLRMSQQRQTISEQAMQAYEELDKERAKLSLYSQKLHEDFNGGTTPYFLIGELNRIRDVRNLVFGMPEDFNWDADYHTEISDVIMKVNKYGESFVDNTHHFDGNYWQYYTGEFNNSTRREVQEKIGNITNEFLKQKTDAITIDTISSMAKDYFDLLDEIPFVQAEYGDVSKIVNQIEEAKRKKRDLEKEIKELERKCDNAKKEILLAFSEDFLSFKNVNDYYKKLVNKYNSFFRYFSSDYKDIVGRLYKFAIKKLKYKAYVHNLGLLVELNKYKDTIKNNKSQISSTKNKIETEFNKLQTALTKQNSQIIVLISQLDYEKLPEYQTYQTVKNILLSEYKLKDFIEKIEDKDSSYKASDIGNIFKKRLLTLSLEMTEFDKKFANYTSQTHNQDVNIFRKYDKETLKISAARVKCELVSKLPSFSSFTNNARGGEIQLLQRELRKKSRLMSTRKLIENLPVLLPQLKPCMMMSPLTVSSYFGTNPSWKFGIVIFDEASQVKPEYAITSIIRGAQVIVAGDSKQMPPTNFFDSINDEEEYDEENPQIDNLESILDEMSSAFPDVYLNWHYRSKDESLIAFSNNKFYNSRLATFPSPNASNDKIGVDFVYCKNGLWESKNGNKPEAEKVALLVFEHIENHPDQSLGIVAFGKSQEYAIEEALNKLRDLHPEKEEFFSDLNPEPFFIKNLENVQGDERDRIILSCGYGKDVTGVFAMRFGPLAITGGERRLNVAISRSKKTMTIVSSFKANEIRGIENNPQRKLIRDFIDYAERGIVALLGESESMKDAQLEFDSGFEEDVYKYLRNKGYKLRTQVGASGYKIDIAVMHPEINGRYILAIECDGAAYHSSRTARDRDVLRQQILEGLGWKFHRIWSTDWLHNNSQERQRLIDAVSQAIKRYGDKSDNEDDDSNDGVLQIKSEILETKVDNTDIELSRIYSSWQNALRKQYRDDNWSNNNDGGWNSLYVMKQKGVIEEILTQVLKYKNGFSPEDVFREINEEVFDKTRYTEQAERIYKNKFKRAFIDKGKVEIVNNSIRLK